MSAAEQAAEEPDEERPDEEPSEQEPNAEAGSEDTASETTDEDSASDDSTSDGAHASAEADAAEVAGSEAEDDDGIAVIDLTNPTNKLQSHWPLLFLYVQKIVAGAAGDIESYVNCELTFDAGEPEFRPYRPLAPEESEEQGKVKFDRLFKVDQISGMIGYQLPRALVYRLVDKLYGGLGDSDGDPARELSPTEHRMIDEISSALNKSLLSTLQSAAASTSALTVQPLAAEQAARAENADPMVCMPVRVGLEEFGQDVLVYCSLGILELLLGVTLRSDESTLQPDAGWRSALKQQVFGCDIPLTCTLEQFSMPISRVSNLAVGDFIPLAELGEATFSANSHPLFRARVGVSNEKASASFIGWL